MNECVKFSSRLFSLQEVKVFRVKRFSLVGILRTKRITFGLFRVPVFVLPSIPEDISDDLMSWFDKSQTVFGSLKEIMLSAFLERNQRLHDMPKKACDVFWWPFTQHKLVPEEKVTVIDSRCGESFAVHKVGILISQFQKEVLLSLLKWCC